MRIFRCSLKLEPVMFNKYSLVPIRSDELSVRTPLPWSVYDSRDNLLLVKGFILESASQIETMAEQGYFRDYGRSSSRRRTGRSISGEEIRGDQVRESQRELVASMDQINWLVGEALDLQLHDNADIRYNVRLIGFTRNKSVLVSAPIVDDKLAFVREGQTFVVRSFFGKRAYAFSASVIKCVHSPHSYLHLSYPSQVRLATVRKGARAEMRSIASVTLGAPERIGAATLVDMSIGGTSCVATHVLGEKGESGTVVFKINVAEQDHIMTLKAVLRSVTTSENKSEYRHGFEFFDMTVHERLVLSAFVNQILVEVND